MKTTGLLWANQLLLDGMPVTKSAKKALRRDRHRTIINLRRQRRYKEAVKIMRQKPSKNNLRQAQKELDKAVKTKLIHQNKAGRLKSRLNKLLTSKTST